MKMFFNSQSANSNPSKNRANVNNHSNNSANNPFTNNLPAKKRLLILTEYFPVSTAGEITGGVESRVFHLTKELAKNFDFDITVVCTRQANQPKSQTVGSIHVCRVGPIQPYSNAGHVFKRFLFAISAFWFILKLKNSFDIIEGTNFITYVPAGIGAFICRKPSIATYHETWVGRWIPQKGLATGIFGEIWERFALHLSWSKIIAVSNFTKNELVKSGISSSKIIVVYNGLSLAESKHIKTPVIKDLIVCVSRLISQKRIDVLLKAFASVAEKLPKAKLVIIGDGDEKFKLETLAGELNIDSKVSFLGFLPHRSEVLSWMKRASVFCLPSINEGFGLVVVEAMALGTPVVCTNISPLTEVTKNGRGSLLFTPDDADDCAAKLLSILSTPFLRFRKSKEALELSKQYDWQSLTLQIREVYNGILR